MEITKEFLTAAVADLNKTIPLDPPMGNFKEEDFTNEEDYMNALATEIKNFCEFESEGTYDLQSGDIPILQKETIEVIREISPDTVVRLKEVFPAVEEVIQETGKQEAIVENNSTPKPNPKPKKEKTKAQERAEFIFATISAGGISQKDLAAKLQNDFKDSETEAKYQANLAIKYLTAFGAIKEENKIFTIS